MKRSLSRQFIAILLIPLVIILATTYIIISYTRHAQTENLKNYCNSTMDNIEINISSQITSMKRTSTMFASKEETQNYLSSSSTDTHQLQRQSFNDLISLSRSYTPDLVDIVVWDEESPTSMISYIPADMERFAVNHFQNQELNTKSYFEFYVNPATTQLYMIYFSPVFMTRYSSDFGNFLGNIAIICRSDTLNKLVNSASDMELNISDTVSHQVLMSNNRHPTNTKASTARFYQASREVSGSNMTITSTIYSDQVEFFSDNQSSLIILLAVMSLFYLLYIAFAVHKIILKPIHQLNYQIESTDYEHQDVQIYTTYQNEIGSIASHINGLLNRVTALNKHNIDSQARLYEMEISKKQTQLYAYQSQINPHFLYNMLQCMRGISIMHGVPEVPQICTNMAALFRYSIKGDFLVELEEELNIVDKYLYMIRVRFQDRINYQLEVEENTKACKIPKMILQPIVENAIFHGLESIEENGLLTIHTFRKDEDLYITIEDNGIGFTPEALEELQTLLEEDIPNDINATFNESKGLGIINIHNKIRLYEGPEYGIKIESTSGHTMATIHLKADETT